MHLVIQNLPHGVINGDDIAILTDRVKQLPGDMHQLYKVMLHRWLSKDAIYTAEAALYLKLLLRTVYLNLFPFWCAIDDNIRQRLLQSLGNEAAVRPRGSEYELASLERCILSQSAGLLRVVQVEDAVPQNFFQGCRVQFIHRTAAGFWRSEDGGQLIQSCRRSVEEFDKLLYEIDLIRYILLDKWDLKTIVPTLREFRVCLAKNMFLADRSWRSVAKFGSTQ